jgi:hypothetical protein
MTKQVRDYWPGNFWSEVKQTLAWLLARQNAPVGNWQGNALPTAGTQRFWQCGIVSTADFSTFNQAAIENIVFDPPVGLSEDSSPGPDGFPINFSPEGLPGGNLFLNTFMLTAGLTVTGRCFSLLDIPANYRVDLFVYTDAFYYKGSCSLVDAGGGRATWSRDVSYGGFPGAMLGVLYPTTVAQPDPGWFGATLPAGWKTHTNLGVGKKLTDYKAPVYSKTDIEYLKQDDIPIMVQDAHHARAGSCVVMGSGSPTMRIYYNDPVTGWVRVFSSLQHLAIFKDLPRSLDVPTSDPDYAHPASIGTRCWIYDAALAILAYCQAGNFSAARRIIDQLDAFLDDPEYLGITVLENFEDGLTDRWTKSNPASSMTVWEDPLRWPFGHGKQCKLTSAAAGDYFTYIGPAVYGSGLPDSVDYLIQWQFRAHPLMTWRFEVSLATLGDSVQKLHVTSDAAADPTYNPATKTITWPIGPGDDDYHFKKFDLQALCQDLAGDTWTSTTGFKPVLTAIGDVHIDNISCGTYQPDGSLSFSYDVYNGLPDQYYIRTGSMAWVCYAYALYMQMSVDYGPALYLQRMLNFLLTLESADPDLRNGLFYGGYGSYEDPGYHYVPGAVLWCSTEHNVGVYFAFLRAARLLPTAALVLSKMGQITAAQAASLILLANTMATKAANLKTKILTNLYLAAEPNELTGLQLWLKADGITGLNDGDPISTWSDESGQGNHATQATAGLKPLYKVNILNGKPAVRFDGINDYLNAHTLLFPPTATVFAVVRNNTKASDAQIISRRSSTASAPIAFQLYLAATDRAAVNARDDASHLAVALAAAGLVAAQIVTGIRNGNDVEVRRNGISVGTGSNTLETTTTDQTRIGAKATGAPTDYLDGDIAELIMYNRVLTDGERDKIEAYLGQKYNIAPLNDPGHFAQGVDSGGLDTAVALDAAGTWSAIFCFEVGDTTKASECLKFVYQKLYLTNKQILKSSDPTTWNMAFEQLALFDGFKPYGTGYASPPASVWQEGVWGMIVALLRCYDLAAVQAYFASVETSLDAFLAKLCRGQRIVRSTTGNGSFLIFSLASKGLPYEFSVWAGIGATAWFYLAAMNPTLLLACDTHPETLPYLIIPQGQNQSVTEMEGSSSIGTVEVECIDPGGVLKGLAAQPNLVGKMGRLKLGFPGQSLGDFVTLHTVQITATGMGETGKLTIEGSDVQRRTQAQFWLNGGPDPWLKGQETPAQPLGPAFAANAFPASDKNPRYVQGNPLDIFLVALQNEAGLGQDEVLPKSAWKLYQPGDDSTLINPNIYLDVENVLALRDLYFSGDWMEFKITKPVEGKQWYESQILKVLGLYAIVSADGKLRLKAMKSPEACQPVQALNERNILGIPGFDRLPVVNVVTVRLGSSEGEGQQEITFEQATSIDRYQQRFRQQIEANGLVLARGGWLRGELIADRIFRRHAFATPHYRVKTQLGAVRIEVGDFVWLNHPQVFDFENGQVGLTNVVCEVIDKQPDYPEATLTFTLLDTRFMNFTTLYRVVPNAAGVPAWPQATDAQKARYMFVSFASTGGLYSDGTPGNTIF